MEPPATAAAAAAPMRPLAFFKQLVHYLSLGTAFCLVLLSILGFQQLSHTTMNNLDQVEATTSDGCLLFLGVSFGLLLFLGEFKWELFFYFFGFLRYRFGRSILYSVSGIMTILMGRTRSGCTGCTSYTLLIAEGIGLLVVALAQFLSMFIFGNNTAPDKRSLESAKTTLVPSTRETAIDMKSVVVTTERVAEPPKSPFESTAPTPKATPKSPTNSSMPSWMQA
ncbi:Aste57867_11145 [Aphanomyces stellatus]|uniref:Aste57867_11145 protein n=1 Tax=Aphanomyces stellatus TaxID=120398 RepID=A0A485KSV1_9STRA|nr:hypothetical protein As57867_011103 [Aphanomyces stellatus]VFT88012.1 Aste57867_11145 [Aphanomyces stellatus]